jgi:hypothetical protein
METFDGVLKEFTSETTTTEKMESPCEETAAPSVADDAAVNEVVLPEPRLRKRPITYGEEFSARKNTKRIKKKAYTWISKQNEAISTISSPTCSAPDEVEFHQCYLTALVELNKKAIERMYKAGLNARGVPRRPLDGVPILNVEGLVVAASSLKRNNCDMGNGETIAFCTAVLFIFYCMCFYVRRFVLQTS